MFLRQSTASQEILLGRFVDSTDGDTAETALTIANTDIKLWKHGATTEANKNSGGATHIADGRYYAVLDATDTDTVGMLEVNVKVAGALSVMRRYQVLEEAVYDALFASGATAPATASALATAQADLDTITGSDGVTLATAQANYAPATAAALATVDSNVDAILVDTGTTLPGTLATLATSAALATVDANVDAILVDTGTTLPATLADIQGATFDTATDSLEAIRNQGDSAWITATGFSTLDAAGIRSAVGLASANLDTQLAAIVADTNELQTDWANGGRLDLLVDAILEDTGTTIPATLTTIDGIVDAILVDTDTTIPGLITTVDTVVDGIKTKTDSLTFTVSGQVDANMQYINDTALVGNGSGTPWGPA